MSTSLFGKSKFGTFKFGRTTLTNSRYGVEVDWNGIGLFDGTNEGKNLNGMTIERGRKYTVNAAGDGFQAEDTGRFSALLLDFERRYDPYNVDSPLYGKLTGGKKFRARVRTPNDDIRDLMAGVLDEPVSFAENRVNKARLEGLDGWSFLRDQKNEVTVPLQENVYADDAMASVLEKAGWPRPWSYELDPGVDLRNYFYVDARSAAQVIHELAQNELGSVSMKGNGNLRFRSRLSQEDEVLQLVDTDCIAVQRMQPKDVVRNMLRIVSTPRAEEALQQVWEVPQRIEISAGETIDDIWADFKYNNVVVPAKDPVTPVATTDYNATSVSDGTGTDLTANISITMSAFSTKAQLSATNTGGSTAHLYVRVRAKPLSVSNSVLFQYKDTDSIAQYGPRPFALYIDQNVNTARQYRELLAIYMTQARNYLIVDLMPNPDVQFLPDLGDILRAKLSNYGIDQAYRVIGIRHEFNDMAGIVMKTRWWLEPYSRLFAGVQIPMQVPFQLGGA